VAVTTRQISDGKETGHLIGVTISQEGRELSRHYIFIRFMSLELAQSEPIWRRMTEGQEVQDGNVYQDFAEADVWEPRIRQFTELEK
jgi:hypothetical protein